MKTETSDSQFWTLLLKFTWLESGAVTAKFYFCHCQSMGSCEGRKVEVKTGVVCDLVCNRVTDTGP